MPIQKLPPHIVNQIAAGEVVERPASIVKELCENSVDAGARSVRVTIDGGGMDRILVEDDGCGIPADQLELALENHTTSKLRTPEDLFSIRTLGFRGEALASIAAVSRLRLSSCVEGSDGAELAVAGEDRGEVEARGLPVGTSLEVRDLFFNLPARRKFLGNSRAESSRIRELLTKLALAHSSCGWRLESEGRQVFSIPADLSLKERISRLLDRDLADELVDCEFSSEGLQAFALLGRPHLMRANRKGQYLFLNGRVVSDRSVEAAMAECYRAYLPPKRFPVWFLFVELDPAQVDVNVHPRKEEVRISGGRRLFGIITRAVGAALSDGVKPPPALVADRLAPATEELQSVSPGSSIEHLSDSIERYHSSPTVRSSPRQTGVLPFGTETHRIDPRKQTGRRSPVPSSPEPVRAERGQAHQFHNAVIIEETDDGLAIIDQHALHEKILYNKLRTAYEAGPVSAQQLLFPVPVDLTAEGKEALLTAQAELLRMGLHVEDFGDQSVAVYALPRLLGTVDPAVVVEELAARLGAGQPLTGAGDLVHLTLATMACKSAIRAGDRLSSDEIALLLSDRESAGSLYSCPHGRPTTIEISNAELEKRFLRR